MNTGSGLKKRFLGTMLFILLGMTCAAEAASPWTSALLPDGRKGGEEGLYFSAMLDEAYTMTPAFELVFKWGGPRLATERDGQVTASGRRNPQHITLTGFHNIMEMSGQTKYIFTAKDPLVKIVVPALRKSDIYAVSGKISMYNEPSLPFSAVWDKNGENLKVFIGRDILEEE